MITFMMDVHIPRQITNRLRIHGIDVLTAQEDGADELPDSALMDRAMVLERVLFSFDEDMLIEAQKRQQNSEPFSGVIYTRPVRVAVGQMISDLLLIAQIYGPAEMHNRVEYLPL